MPRRSIIKPGRTRAILALAGCFAILLAAVTCTVRIARYWNTFDAAGAGTYRSAVIEHGQLTWETNTGPFAPAPGAPAVLNYQIDPGVSWSLFKQRTMTYPAPTGGLAVATTNQIGIATPLTVIAVTLIVLTLPLRRRPPGECRCGYDLSRLASAQCPECGATIGSSQSQSKAITRVE